MRILEVRELSFKKKFSYSSIRHFFYASFRQLGRFRFVCIKGVRSRKNKVLWKNTTWNEIEGWRFLYKQDLLDLVFTSTTESIFALARKTDLQEVAKGYGNMWSDRQRE